MLSSRTRQLQCVPLTELHLSLFNCAELLTGSRRHGHCSRGEARGHSRIIRYYNLRLIASTWLKCYFSECKTALGVSRVDYSSFHQINRSTWLSESYDEYLATREGRFAEFVVRVTRHARVVARVCVYERRRSI